MPPPFEPDTPRRTLINHLAGLRLQAYALDCLGYLGVAALLAVPGVIAYLTLPALSFWPVWGLSLIPAAVATVWAAAAESGPHAATRGKRARGLRVGSTDGGPLPRGRALLRNVAKIAIPWQLGHTVALGASFGLFETGAPFILTATALTYVVVGVGVGMTVLGSGRPPHDRLAGSRVVAAPHGSGAGSPQATEPAGARATGEE
ncbi:RDD family protein [Propioniciclava coleopterorum]|uniref:RDD family protein n=1 Tax=Propioniciclava coleopterorum TaxID=2714937 RepID=A0A6G7Y6V3_9ACTN|nr:RDD family protein [Propioniciclava coleopterorum]QIK72520.1 RDD family protein [Propioniciclava coleopterorum]